MRFHVCALQWKVFVCPMGTLRLLAHATKLSPNKFVSFTCPQSLSMTSTNLSGVPRYPEITTMFWGSLSNHQINIKAKYSWYILKLLLANKPAWQCVVIYPFLEMFFYKDINDLPLCEFQVTLHTYNMFYV